MRFGFDMPQIIFNDASVSLPIFNATGRSLTSKILEVATGGRLDASPDGKVVVQALRNLTFSIQAGERVALVGHNGAGKSTLLRALAGVYAPTTGNAMIEGTIGSLIDVSLGINPEATGRENIYIRGRLLGFTKNHIQEKYEKIVEFSELGNFIDMPVRTYSSGMHLRLAFSVSTEVRPEILLMDEWLSVGDESFREKSEKRLAELVEATQILVIATHTRQLVESSCNRVIWLEHGQIKMDGPVAEIVPLYFG